MAKMKKNGLKQDSRKIFWIISGLLILIISGLIFFIGKLSIDQVRRARQAYYNEIAKLKKKDVEITIIEGWRREQIAAKLIELGILTSTDEFLKSTENLEGRLFPDTYRFFANSTAQTIIEKLTANYLNKTRDLKIDDSTLTLASIIEREAASDSERADIAGIYQNRLDEGMKLEADPTAQYARDSREAEDESRKTDNFEYWAAITREEIDAIDSPYNTYKYAGLPPNPICNPGIKSIEASLNPTKHRYFYFFHDSSGQLILSRNFNDHNYQKKIYGVRQ